MLQACKCFFDEKILQPTEMLSTGGFRQIEEEVVYLGSLGVLWASSALHRPFQEACSIFSSEKHLQAFRTSLLVYHLLPVISKCLPRRWDA